MPKQINHINPGSELANGKEQLKAIRAKSIRKEHKPRKYTFAAASFEAQGRTKHRDVSGVPRGD